MIPRAWWEREGRRLMRALSRLAGRGRGFDGRALAPKRQGGPVGRDGAGLGVAGLLLDGRVATTPSSVRVDYSHLPALVYFNEGTSRQTARPVIGVSREQRAGFVLRLRQELRRRVEARLRRGR